MVDKGEMLSFANSLIINKDLNGILLTKQMKIFLLVLLVFFLFFVVEVADNHTQNQQNSCGSDHDNKRVACWLHKHINFPASIKNQLA